MPLLARILRQRRAWVQLGEDIPDDMGFPAGVISDLYDARGASFWLVSDREGEDVSRLVANLSCATSARQLSAVEMRFVDEETVKALGIVMKATKANEGIDKGFSNRHRDLYIETAGQAVKLARKMLLIEAVIMIEADVARCIAGSIEKGYFDIGAINRDMLKALASVGALRIGQR
jgi:hypothetical protein